MAIFFRKEAAQQNNKHCLSWFVFGEPSPLAVITWLLLSFRALFFFFFFFFFGGEGMLLIASCSKRGMPIGVHLRLLQEAAARWGGISQCTPFKPLKPNKKIDVWFQEP